MTPPRSTPTPHPVTFLASVIRDAQRRSTSATLTARAADVHPVIQPESAPIALPSISEPVAAHSQLPAAIPPPPVHEPPQPATRLSQPPPPDPAPELIIDVESAARVESPLPPSVPDTLTAPRESRSADPVHPPEVAELPAEQPEVPPVAPLVADAPAVERATATSPPSPPSPSPSPSIRTTSVDARPESTALAVSPTTAVAPPAGPLATPPLPLPERAAVSPEPIAREHTDATTPASPAPLPARSTEIIAPAAAAPPPSVITPASDAAPAPPAIAPQLRIVTHTSPARAVPDVITPHAAPREPDVQIGRVDVVIAAPAEQTPPAPVAPRSANTTSRRYLRSL